MLLVATTPTITTVLGATCSVIFLRPIVRIDKVIFVLEIMSILAMDFRQAAPF